MCKCLSRLFCCGCKHDKDNTNQPAEIKNENPDYL